MSSTSTAIQWTDRTWNPVRGCSRVSPGCDNCYAMKVAHRFSGPGKPYEGLTTIRRGKVDWRGIARFIPSALDEPLHWRKPARIFVNSMSDLFHHSVTNEEIAAVFGVMAACPQHTFQVLTKRAERMREWFEWVDEQTEHEASAWDVCMGAAADAFWPIGLGEFWQSRIEPGTFPEEEDWPLPNVWLGVSTEDQQRADERIPHLLATPAAVRFVSAEPLLGPIDFARIPWGGLKTDVLRGWSGPEHGLHWVIVGGESGPGARIADAAHHRAIIKQCREAGVAVFHKQVGANVIDSDFGLHPVHLKDRKGGDPSEWADDLRVRQFPPSEGEK